MDAKGNVIPAVPYCVKSISQVIQQDAPPLLGRHPIDHTPCLYTLFLLQGGAQGGCGAVTGVV